MEAPRGSLSLTSFPLWSVGVLGLLLGVDGTEELGLCAGELAFAPKPKPARPAETFSTPLERTPGPPWCCEDGSGLIDLLELEAAGPTLISEFSTPVTSGSFKAPLSFGRLMAGA